MTEREPKTQIFAQKTADFRRKPSLLLEIQALGGHRKPQKMADFRRKPKIFAENRRKPQIGLRHLRCVTFSSALGDENGRKKDFGRGKMGEKWPGKWRKWLGGGEVGGRKKYRRIAKCAGD